MSLPLRYSLPQSPYFTYAVIASIFLVSSGMPCRLSVRTLGRWQELTAHQLRATVPYLPLNTTWHHLSNPTSLLICYSQDRQVKIFAWENSAKWSHCYLFPLISGSREGNACTLYASRFVARSLRVTMTGTCLNLLNVIVKSPGLLADLERKELRNMEPGLPIFAVTKDHERD